MLIKIGRLNRLKLNNMFFLVTRLCAALVINWYHKELEYVSTN